MDLVIREAVIDDAEGLGAAHVAAWQAAYRGLMPPGYLARLDPQARGDHWRRSIAAADSPATVLIARTGDRVAGFASFGPPRDDVEPGWGELWAINVHPEFWRQGVGRSLFSEAANGLSAVGYQHGYLWVLQGNERAISFYRRMGWTPDGGTKIDDRQDFRPPLTELRCSSALPR